MAQGEKVIALSFQSGPRPECEGNSYVLSFEKNRLNSVAFHLVGSS